MEPQQQMEKIQEQMDVMLHSYWSHNLFKWQWWLLLGLTIIPWVIWWKVVDKKRVHEIFGMGFVVTIIATLLDVLGWNHYMWTYPIQLLPMCTPLFPFDLTIVPVSHMLVYQYFRTWKSFILAEIVAALFFAFISEPLLVKFGIYKVIKWKHLYSFPIYLGKTIVGKWLIEKMKKLNAVEQR